MNRAENNRTLTLNEDEIIRYTGLCPCTYESENSIIHGDVFDVLKTIPAGIVDLLIVDPPYNLSKIYGQQTFKKMNDEEYSSFSYRWLDAVKHTLKPNASVYVCSDWQTSIFVGKILGEFFTVQNRITWQREKGRGAVHNWKNAMEDIWFATVSPKFTFNVNDVKMRRRVLAPYKIDGEPKDWTKTSGGNFRDTFPSNFWDDISIPYWSMPENTDHPTQKPEKLFAKLILASSNAGEIILDPFAGSGTSAVVAKKLGRKFIAIEREAEYCAYAQKRLENAKSTPGIQGYVDGVFWERNTLAAQKKAMI
ncbi:MAG: site-specific DNA-methyltransferase [Clostridiales bacterium]|jgi:site-specific DNA-methyltransferase (adenine-specific)|nr:site-specific DNA-methyltransferase [Clostridiales bacterium]